MSEQILAEAMKETLPGRSLRYAIQTRELTRRFGKLEAVDGLELQVPAGALYGLIGPNGAGKTTTLRMLAGLLEPTQGEIRINDLPVRQYWRELQWQVGYMPDVFGVYTDLVVWEYLDFFARCYRVAPERRQRVIDELLQLVDLSEKRDAYVQTLSRGMKQRLCLAHALVHDPQILLLDEPASGLDPRARVEMRELLRELSKMGKTIVLSSHILTELAELCDWVAIMERGKLVTSGPMAQIRSQVASHKLIRLTILSDLEQALALLNANATVQQVYPRETAPDEPAQVEIEFNGDLAAAAELLESLVRQRVRVAAFNEVTTDLEQAFLRLTKGEVA
ncbi:MAG: ABC transporter ATP-binding protein [Chloroflexota bacterium]